MDFIEVEIDNCKKRTILLNLRNVRYFTPNENGKTTVVFKNGDFEFLENTFDEIREKLDV